MRVIKKGVTGSILIKISTALKKVYIILIFSVEFFDLNYVTLVSLGGWFPVFSADNG